MNHFVTRKAQTEDFEQVLPLTIMAIEDLADQFTSSSDPEVIKERMLAAYTSPNTRFSKEYAVIVEAVDDNGKREVAGVGFAYPGRDMRNLTKQTIEAYQRVGATYEAEDVQRLLNSKEAQWGEFYIDNLAVYETYRGHGLSKKILAALESEGKQQGFDRISILADINNPKAKAIYEKMGYIPDSIYEVLEHKYHHMVKII
ncbi:N-acetyltransferase [Alkalicella caledoniensis]|uniref:N-acetyltransferase n=1 Tax=Alkalicella caledoniensis TaxID=2731377 RepID=A0A7G9WBA8_ALKCA|nr:GNAT family N-acetyltransferase [Alkalicella caledoniensis]QNO15970.1 N-acetyltransferase [Alkalicella caledoniensis]